jgi:uncharacterized membrane protein
MQLSQQEIQMTNINMVSELELTDAELELVSGGDEGMLDAAMAGAGVGAASGALIGGLVGAGVGAIVGAAVTAYSYHVAQVCNHA